MTHLLLAFKDSLPKNLCFPTFVNDPSEGSPTETLLRLLLPLDDQVRPSSRRAGSEILAGCRSNGLTKPSNR
jgi:hypothetical protein